MEEKIEKTFATPEGCDLVVENVKGQITVEGWDRPETEVVAVQRKGGVEIEISQDGRKVIARTKHERGPLGWFDWFGNTPVVDYTVHVPHASNLKLKNVNGPISAAQVKGDVQVNNVDGTAKLDAINGHVKAETVNGTLEANALEGTAKLNAVNGKLRVASGTLSRLKAETVNGHIDVTAALNAEGEYSFHTVNGSCHLTVPSNLRAHVSAHGVNLSVDCKLPSSSVKHKFGSWEGTIGAGDGPTAEIKFNTVNGHLRIGTGEAVSEPPTPPAPPAPPTEPVEVKVAEAPAAEEADTGGEKSQVEVLKMVESGEISVEEAIELLKG